MRLNLSILLVFVLILSVVIVAAEVAPQPKIQVTLLNQDPDPIKQDDVVEVRFKIENIGKETNENVQVRIEPDFPFSLYSGKSTVDIGKLKASQTGADAVIIGYKLKVDQDAEEGENEIKLQLKVEGSWQSYNDNDFFIDVEDYDFPEIKVYVKDSTIKSAGQMGEVVIEVANTNLEDIKFLQLSLLPSEDYELLSSSNYVYIGDVDSDDTESEEFEIFANSGINGDLILPVQLEYQDSNEKAYKEEYMLKLKLFDSSEAKKVGLTSGNKTGLISGIVVLVLIAGYFFWWRKRKKR